jgi:hypothetical protein
MREQLKTIVTRVGQPVADGLSGQFLDKVEPYFVPDALAQPNLRHLRYALSAVAAAERSYRYREVLLVSPFALLLADYFTVGIAPGLLQVAANTLQLPGVLPAVYCLGLGAATWLLRRAPSTQALTDTVQGWLGAKAGAVQDRVFAPIKTWLAGADQTALTVANQLSAAFQTESAELWPGWISWIISLLASSDTGITINQSDSRLVLDRVENDILTKGLTLSVIISSVRQLNAISEELGYHASGAQAVFAAKVQSVLAAIAARLSEFNRQVQKIYVLLDGLEEQLLLKPGVLTGPFDAEVQKFYHHLYSFGHSFGKHTVGRERVYHAAPPFTQARREAAERRSLARQGEGVTFAREIYLDMNRFKQSDMARIRAALKILSGHSLLYLYKMALQFKSPDACKRLVRLAALFSMDEASESQYLLEYQLGERTIGTCYTELKTTFAALYWVMSERAGRRLDSQLEPLAFDAARDTSHEAYYQRLAEARREAVAGIDDEHAAFALLLCDAVVNDAEMACVDAQVRFFKQFFELFGQKGQLVQKLGRLSAKARVQLSLLQGEADAIFNQGALLGGEKVFLLKTLVQHYFKVEDIEPYKLGFCRREMESLMACADAGQVAYGVTEDVLPVTQAMVARQDARLPTSVLVYNLVKQQRYEKAGLLGKDACQGNELHSKAVHTLEQRLRDIMLRSALSEGQKQHAMCKAFLVAKGHCRDAPLLRQNISMLLHAAFERPIIEDSLIEHAKNLKNGLAQRARQAVLAAGRVQRAAGRGHARGRQAGSRLGSTSVRTLLRSQRNRLRARTTDVAPTSLLDELAAFDLNDAWLRDRLVSMTLMYLQQEPTGTVVDREAIDVLKCQQKQRLMGQGSLASHPIWLLLSLLQKHARRRGGSQLLNAFREACEPLRDVAVARASGLAEMRRRAGALIGNRMTAAFRLRRQEAARRLTDRSLTIVATDVTADAEEPAPSDVVARA